MNVKHFSFAVFAAVVFATSSLRADLNWQLPQFGSISGNHLTITVPQESMNEWAMATASLDLSAYAGKAVDVSISCRGENVSEPSESWLGLKVMLHLKNADGTDSYPQAARKSGTFDWSTFTIHQEIPDPAPTSAQIQLGLQSAYGTVDFDLSTFKVSETEPIFPITNQDYVVTYPDSVRDKPPRRGVMLPNCEMTENDFRTLQSWGVTLGRYQMGLDWGVTYTKDQLDLFTQWLNGKLDVLERMLPLARQYGVEIVVDLHSPPGGRGESDDMCMFHDEDLANYFVECWELIATRLKGKAGIFGYDLINEPVQTRRAAANCDFWNLQRRAAEAVRAIDPTPTIIVESNGWADPGAFAQLSPLAMSNVIYQAHVYTPHGYTHQGVDGDWEKSKWPDESKGWGKEYLRQALTSVLAFRQRHNARIYIGEFSAVAWAEGAENYLADCISLFNEYGFDWSYHAFREWEGWSVEHEPDPDRDRQMVASSDNPRKRALLAGFAYGQEEDDDDDDDPTVDPPTEPVEQPTNATMQAWFAYTAANEQVVGGAWQAVTADGVKVFLPTAASKDGDAVYVDVTAVFPTVAVSALPSSVSAQGALSAADGNLHVYAADGWTRLTNAVVAADAAKSYRVEFDYASEDAPRLRVWERGATDYTELKDSSGASWFALTADTFKCFTSLAFSGDGTIGDFVGTCETGPREVVTIEIPSFTDKDGNVKGGVAFRTVGSRPVFSVTIANGKAGVYYTAFVANALSADPKDWSASADAVKPSADGLLTLDIVRDDSPAKFAKIVATPVPVSAGTKLDAVR